MNCPNCGTSNAPEAFVCSSCGTSLVSATPSADPSPPSEPGPPPQQPPPAETQAFPPEAPPPATAQYPAPGGYPPPGAQQYPPPGTPAPGAPGAQQYPPPGAPGGPPGAPGSGGYPQPVPGQPYPPAGPQGYPGQFPPPGAPGGPGGPGFGPPPGAFPGYQPGGPGPGPGQDKGSKGKLYALLGLLLVVAIGAAAFIVTKKDETGTSVGASIVLEPVTSLGNDPFSESFDEEELSEPLSIALAGFPDLGKDVATALAGRASRGTAPGLYGGSQNESVCKIDDLVAFLTDSANEAKAKAWATTLGIDQGDIESYVRGLTPVRLRFDTRVTNHGFRDGKATPLQSLLQAGTGVLVDNKGVPRVKCNCGNPLLEPAPLGEVPSDEEDKTLDIQFVASNPDAAWEGLDPNNVVGVEPGDETDTFTLVDLETGRFFKRTAGTSGEEDTFVEVGDETELCDAIPESPSCQAEELGSGDVQLTLQWGSEADIDLHVIEPDGTEIYWDATTSASGGALDLDSNAQCAPGPAVEHIVWPTGTAPEGEYKVIVNGFDFTADDGSDCGSGEYQLTVNVGGEETVYDGTVGQDENQEYTFQA